jgi:hypothetical protein
MTHTSTDKNMELTVENLDAMAEAVLGTLQAMDDQLTEVEGKHAKHVRNKVRRALRVVEDIVDDKLPALLPDGSWKRP